MTDPASWAERSLGYEFRDRQLIALAVTHRSASHDHNERLEFLGDAVLGLVVSEALYRSRTTADEGEMSRLRARLVRRETLEEVARGCGLGDVVRLGSGEVRTGGHQRGSILANALEAAFGAVFCDGGFSAAREVVLRLLADQLARLPTDQDLRDPKTRLQELLQAHSLPLPVYAVVQVSGPPHDQRFDVVCRVPGLDLDCPGSGSSRRAAEQQAAEAALRAALKAMGRD